jgi:hypothetical protein
MQNLYVLIVAMLFGAGASAQVTSFTYGNLTSVGSISGKSGSGGDVLTVPITYTLGTDQNPQVILSYVGPGGVPLPAGTITFSRSGLFTIRISAQSLVGRYTCQGVSVTESPAGTNQQQIWARGGEYYANGGRLQPNRHAFNIEALDFDIVAPVAPQITSPPISVSAPFGQTVTFAVTATGSPAPTYQWYHGSVLLAGKTNASYSFVSQDVFAGTYTVEVTNAGGVARASATLTVLPPQPTISIQPANQTVAAGGRGSFSVVATGTGLTYQWRLNGGALPGATSSTLVIDPVSSTHAGGYSVTVSNAGGTVTSSTATLSVGPTGPVVAVQPNASVGTGTNVTLTATSAGGRFQWYFNDVAISGATSATYSIRNIGTHQAGSYRVDDSGSGTTLRSNVVALVVASTAKPVNLSTRGIAGPGAGALFVGFVVSGSTSETVLIRGVGPTLAQFGVANALKSTRLSVFDQAGELIATNAGWTGSPVLSAIFARVGAFGLSPASLDSALLLTLPPGAYTAQLTPNSDETGAALVEIYDVP